VAKANQAQPSNTQPQQKEPVAPRKRRLYVLLAVLLALGGVGVWVHHGRSPLLPDLPTIDIASADSEVADALSAARTDVAAHRQSGEAWGRYAMILHAHKYLTEAAVCYEAAGTLDEGNMLWPYLHGIILQSGGEPASALPYLGRAAALAPADAPPRLLLADLLQQLGRLDEAAAEYQQALTANRHDGHAQLGLGQVAVARKQYRDALRFLHVVQDNPYARKRACVLRLTVYERLGQPDAVDSERQRLAKLPKDADDPPWPDFAKDTVLRLQVGLKARLQRAPHLLRQGRVGEAVALLSETTRRYPDSDLAWATLGSALANGKDYARAEGAFKKAIDLAKENPDHWFNLGYFRQTHRQHQAAAAAYRHALHLRPTEAQTHFHLGECLEELHDRKNATDAFRSALRYRPDMEEARTRLRKLERK
jgi:tetratricopeptide (TPR) repeat protein